MDRGRHLEAAALGQARSLLKDWLASEAKFDARSGTAGKQADIVVRTPRCILVIEVKATDRVAQLASAIEQARHVAPQFGRTAVPVVVVPFMSEGGQRLCREAGVSWFDLSGNAQITGAGLRILIAGKPNAFKRRGRPSTVFAPRSSRIARVLLMDPSRTLQQRELARAAQLDEGFTSRILQKLEDDALVERDSDGAIRCPRPGLLLEAWREAYAFSKHRILKGHVPGRAPEDSLKRVVSAFKRDLVLGVTGLSGAWLLTRFAGFRLTTVILNQVPDADALEAAGFREEERGANTWIVIPNDDGVLMGATTRHGLPCAHPLQVYLDLKAHPERSDEAADELRRRFLSWST
jgi:hypothetical protein